VSMTHGQLCQRAARWLKTAAVIADESYGRGFARVKCSVVLSELVCTAREIPDAIGWAHGGSTSILVECKTSRADFRADQKKWFRKRPHIGMGRYRYYLAPAGVIPLDDVPELWGLLDYREDGSVQVVRLAHQHRHRNKDHEMAMLWSALRRVNGLEMSLVASLPCDQEEHF